MILETYKIVFEIPTLSQCLTEYQQLPGRDEFGLGRKST